MLFAWPQIWDSISSPGRKVATEATADTQLPYTNNSSNTNIASEQLKLWGNEKSAHERINNSLPDLESTQSKEPRSSLASRIFDAITRLAGTKYTFFLMCTALLTWAIVGIVTGATQVWQIVIQDSGSIQCYISDTLLIRQQQNHGRALLKLICRLRSRNMTCKRLLQQVRQNNIIVPRNSIATPTRTTLLSIEQKNLLDTVHLPVENWYDRTSNVVVNVIGSLYSLIFYWAGILVWVGMGSKLHWGDLWQLDINTAVAVELTFTTVFLQNTRHRHMQYLEECFQSMIHADAQMERNFRQITGDKTPNPVAVITSDRVSVGNRAIDYYAAIMGSGAGVVISAIVFIVWISIGPKMQWNSNWWLIIGTFTGLVGFVDGYVLRNDYFRENAFIDVQMQRLEEEDSALYESLGIPILSTSNNATTTTKTSLQHRISKRLGSLLSHPHAVLIAIIIVAILLAGASGLHWSETGQLICNTPTMIIEGFFLLVLIQAHNMVNENRRTQFKEILVRRLTINAQLEQLFPDISAATTGSKVMSGRKLFDVSTDSSEISVV